MPTVLPIERFLEAGVPVLDVRSPGEFTQGHIPGAVNLPLFSDGERAAVGTLYKQQGRDAAMLEGLRIVGPKLATLVEQARSIAPGGKVAVHCWRGGERSASVAWLLEKAGYVNVATLAHGYKAFRHHVLASIGQPWNLQVLGGFTGTGKTRLLQQLRQQGAQVLDLEALARHRGSAFGGIGQPAQPSTEQFENLIWAGLRHMNPGRPVWVEDESQLVGHAKIPDAFFLQMRNAPLTFVDLPLTERARNLVEDYGFLHKEELAAAVLRIQKRLGPQWTKAALEALDNDNLGKVAEITLAYYDKTYRRGLAHRPPEGIRRIPATNLSVADLAQHILEDDQ